MIRSNQGDIVFVNLNPTRGVETQKQRPCLVVSNDEYNKFMNTQIIIPISSAKKYQTIEKYKNSPMFVTIHTGKINGTAMLQHVRTVDMIARSNGNPVGHISEELLSEISETIRQFF